MIFLILQNLFKSYLPIRIPNGLLREKTLLRLKIIGIFNKAKKRDANPHHVSYF